MKTPRPEQPRVGLFVTCLVDMMRPSIGFAAARLLQDAGCHVEVPAQTCCGQPAFNSGDRGTASDLARAMIRSFSHLDYVVAPSGSCAGMVRRHYPELFADDPDLRGRAVAFAEKTWELTSFLVDVMGVSDVNARFNGVATYHDSCAGLREMNVQTQPRKLLESVRGLTLTEMSDPDVCCGFGGTFAVKYGEISDAIVREKTARIAESGAPMVLAGDLGCLMNMAGKLSRQQSQVTVRHVAEVLAGMNDLPPIAAPAHSSPQSPPLASASAPSAAAAGKA